MTRTHWAVFVVALSFATAACERPTVPTPATAEPPSPSPATAPGSTDPNEVIEARRLLMIEAGRQIEPIDLYTLGTPMDAAAIKTRAVTIETLLLALPHLFPPSTNLFDPSTREPPTIALPAVWENWAAFEQMAASSERAAAELAAADGDAALLAAAQNLRATCDACHQAFTKPYAPPQVTDEDRDFDFDEFLPK